MKWRPLTPDDAVRLMRGYERPWWIGGGWALDLFLDRSTRTHADLDVVVLRDDQDRLREHLVGWDLQIAHLGSLTPWRGDRLELPLHGLWGRADAAGPWEIEFLLMESDGERWLFRRDPRTTLPLADAGLRREGVPYLVPEIPLLYKSKEPRDRDETDFAAVLPQLTPDRRAWLRAAIASQDPSHPWLAALDGRRPRQGPR